MSGEKRQRLGVCWDSRRCGVQDKGRGRSFEVAIWFENVAAVVAVTVVVVAEDDQEIDWGTQRGRWGKWESQTLGDKSPWGWHSCPAPGSIESKTDLRRS